MVVGAAMAGFWGSFSVTAGFLVDLVVATALVAAACDVSIASRRGGSKMSKVGDG